ncbi:MAG TPA: hypothetical protein VLV56_01340 [Burkholderiales bacterium]|nr:hypothetical protein [Burkholderiales bacterium]
MSTRKVLTLVSIVGMLFSPVAFSGVVGEKLDSGLGDLSPNYTAAEFQRTYHVAGESLDSGLGDLSPSYTAAEFQGKEIVAIR